MVKEFRSSTDDSSDSGFGRYKGAGPSSAPGRYAGNDSDNSSDDKEDPKKESDGTETQEKGVVHEG